MQRYLGNAYVQQVGAPRIQRACACGGTCPDCAGHGDEPRLQARLTVGPPGDRYEREAERVAEQVMRMPAAGADVTVQPGPSIQRLPAGKGGVPVHAALPMSGARPLSAQTRAFMEPRFGRDFGGVRLHTGAAAEQAAAGLGARAFTVGRDVWLGRGEREGDHRLMAHELTHVVQQRDTTPAHRIQRLVEAGRVSCSGYDRSLPIFTVMGTNDPVGVIQGADTRAIELLTHVIDELAHIRARIAAGEPPGWPLIGDAVALALRTHLQRAPDDPAFWTGTGAGTVEIIIRWFTNIRGLLQGGRLHYTCIDPNCGAGSWAESVPGTRRVFLCRPFWPETRDNQALTLLHEAAHLYYGLEDTGGGAGNAHCLEQFVADMSGIAVDPQFVGSCTPPAP